MALLQRLVQSYYFSINTKKNYRLFYFQLLAVVRANIAALGGNAMVSFYMTELILVDNQHKNQVNIFDA